MEALDDVYARRDRVAQELCEGQSPRTKEIDVEETFAEEYMDEETVEEQGEYVANEQYQEQEPYTATETYEEQEPYTDWETYTEQVPYSTSSTRVVPKQHNVLFVSWTTSATEEHTTTNYRSETKSRPTTRWRQVQKTREVTRYRMVQKEREVTRYRTVERVRPVTRSRNATRIVTKTVQHMLLVEDFYAEALQRVVAQIRERFSVSS